MTWLEGEPLMTITDNSIADRNEVARHLFHAWYVPFYRYAVIHADPHLGNYTVCPDNAINLLDFGCVRVFNAKFVTGVIDLYHSLVTGDRDLAVHAYETWGLRGPLAGGHRHPQSMGGVRLRPAFGRPRPAYPGIRH